MSSRPSIIPRFLLFNFSESRTRASRLAHHLANIFDFSSMMKNIGKLYLLCFTFSHFLFLLHAIIVSTYKAAGEQTTSFLYLSLSFFLFLFFLSRHSDLDLHCTANGESSQKCGKFWRNVNHFAV